MVKNLSILENEISYKFKNKNLLKQALTHKSYKKSHSNESLEFLGDRVLGLVIAEKLIMDNPDKNEGSLDKIFSSLVDRNACYEVANEIFLGDYILLGQTEQSSFGSKKKSILSDACEAILGAIYLDSGFTNVQKVILTLWQDKLLNIEEDIIDAKSMLQEWTLKKYKALPTYKVVSKDGPDHDPKFKINVEFMNFQKATGNASSIKEAEKDAAHAFIKKNKINSA